MLIFGCCAGPTDKFARVAEQPIRAAMAPDDRLVVENGCDGICAAYNRIIDIARATPTCEGIVLLHDDVELRGDARPSIVAALARPDVGVVGPVGGRGMTDNSWWGARARFGYLNHTYGEARFPGSAFEEVDVVDCLFLAIAPCAYRSIAFDAASFPAFHGYDTDFCLAVRDAGLRVRVAPIDYKHFDKGSVGDIAAYDAAAARLAAKWPQWIRPLTARERLSARLHTTLGSYRHRSAVRVKQALHR